MRLTTRLTARSMRRLSARYSRGQTLVIVAILLPLLVAMLALVVDVVNVSVQHQRLSGAAQLSADAGATIAARDVVAVLVVRHWCQPSISFAAWDTPACTTADTNSTDQNLSNLRNDCPWVLSGEILLDATTSDSDVLATCIGESFWSYTMWPRASAANLHDNEPMLYDSSIGFVSCANACDSSNGASSDCYSPQIICIEVSATTVVAAPLIGTAIGAIGTQTIQEVGYASVSLPGSCTQLKSLLNGGPGDCPPVQ